MKTFTVAAAFIIMTGFFSPARAWATEALSCECEKITCAPCETEASTDFYTSKCGEHDSKVKSCKRPLCEPVENQKQCLAALNSTSAASRALASVKAAPVATQSIATSRWQPAGTVTEIEGDAFLTRSENTIQGLAKGFMVYEADVLETKANSKLRVSLTDGSELTLAANSKLTVVAASVSESKKSRKILLNLIRGKVRSRVTKNFEDENTFEVKTRTAVAGVRGTDFVTSFDQGDKEWVTEVKTIEGKVRLGAVGSSDSMDARFITAGTSASFVIDTPQDASESNDLSVEIGRGFLTPLLQFKEDDLKLLIDATDFQTSAAPIGASVTAATTAKTGIVAVALRSPASDDGDICASPAGKFNQCSYKCEGNPRNAKTCRTDLPEVSCVRKLCQADGQWDDQTRVPASQSGSCHPTKIQVRSCDSYW